MDSTKTPDATDALATQGHQRPSAPLWAALGDLTEFAVALGRKHRLQASDGRWHCWECGTELEAFAVHLHCEWCYQEALKKAPGRLRRALERSAKPAPSSAAKTFVAESSAALEVWERG